MNTETDHIVAALDGLLTAYRAELDRQERANGERPEVGELEWGAPGVTRAKVLAHSIIADPVGRALTMAMETLGRRLFEIGGLGEMSRAMDRTAAMSLGQESWREGVLDRRWSGIGDWAS